ncbi:unnamed protein product [Allacma fusca]|uniref:Peptidase S1 domain-containing protein n=1 Tax=Allacma fusca TaxID=39272 RepID=A0A8J2Q2M4_9HEXA|nr:unnamed protein product [Allacma fusca]
MFLFNFFIVLSLPWTCQGQQKKARIDLKLVDGICGQYAAFETTKLLQPPLKKSVSSLHGEVRWQNCGLLSHLPQVSYNIICTSEPHPKFDKVTKSNNFAVIMFTHDVMPPEKFRNVSFAKQGQTFNGPCKYQSWGKLNLLNRIHSYADDLREAELKILPSHECATAGFPSTHICTPPVLCGLSSLSPIYL